MKIMGLIFNCIVLYCIVLINLPVDRKITEIFFNHSDYTYFSGCMYNILWRVGSAVTYYGHNYDVESYTEYPEIMSTKCNTVYYIFC